MDKWMVVDDVMCYACKRTTITTSTRCGGADRSVLYQQQFGANSYRMRVRNCLDYIYMPSNGEEYWSRGSGG